MTAARAEAEGVDVGAVARRWAPVGASVAVAVVAASTLALRLAPRYDEMHTLSHLGDADLGALWSSYRATRDTLPPAGYVVPWLWAKVLGDGILAARVPVVLSWGVAAGALSLLTRRAGPWPSFLARVGPSATGLLYLGAFARPYAPALAALALGVLCWQRSGEVERRGWWLTGGGVAFALASSLHHLTATVPFAVAVATVWGPGRARPIRSRAVAPLAGGVAPVVASLPLVSRAVEDQGRLDRSVRTIDPLAFWPSTLRPALIVVVGTVVVALVAVARSRRAHSQRGLDGGRGPDAPGLSPELVWAGWLVVVATPVLTVVAMTLTSGVYVHRYAMGAVIGAAILVAALSTSMVDASPSTGPIFGALAVVGVILVVAQLCGSFLGAGAARQLPEALALDGRGSGPVVVLDEYDLRLLRTYGDEALAGRMVLGAPATIADSPEPVDVDALLSVADGPVDVVGDAGQVREVLEDQPGWRGEEVGSVTYVRPGVDRLLVHERLTRP